MDALAYFTAKLQHETDAADVYDAMRAGDPFVLVDVRSEEAWRQGHIRGAVHMPHREIAGRSGELDPAVPVVVYCWSPGCNGGTRGAIEFLRAGFAVREMIGGYEYWTREGYPTDSEAGPVERTRDPLVSVVRSA